jgi:hypothetical protein
MAISRIRKLYAHSKELWTPKGLLPVDQPGVTPLWPKCFVCGGPVDAYEVAHEGSKSLDIVAKCHGKEDAVRISWEDDGMTMSDFMSQMAKTVFFHGKEER